MIMSLDSVMYVQVLGISVFFYQLFIYISQDVNVSPNEYGVEKYLTLTVDKQPSR